MTPAAGTGAGGGGGSKENPNGVGSPSSHPPPKPAPPAKFAVYQNPAISAALTATSLRPPASAFVALFLISSASAVALVAFTSRENGIVNYLKSSHIPEELAYLLAKVAQIIVGLAFIGAAVALVKAIPSRRVKIGFKDPAYPSSNGALDKSFLTDRQLSLLGLKPSIKDAAPESSKKPPKHKSLMSSTASEVLVPIHLPTLSSNISATRIIADKSTTSGGKTTQTFGTPSKSPGSSLSPYPVPYATSQASSVQTSPIRNKLISSPWSNSRASPSREIATEDELEQFLADVDKKITESAEKLGTPPSARSGFNIGSPAIMGPANTSGSARSLRPVRMSPGSHKFSSSPKKGEADLPSPMSMEESIEAFEHLGIYPQIEDWRDRLRQWFSSALLNPLLSKIETSHIQIMDAATKLGISITVSPVISVSPTAESPTSGPEEEGLLHQLRASLVQTLDASQRSPMTIMQQSAQQNAIFPLIQECVDAITEHQRLHTLLKGELIKGLLPQISIPTAYTVQHIRELAEGTCLRNYEHQWSPEIYDKLKKKYTLELPDDSRLLLYLFCAFLEHPRWMLHVDPPSYPGAQSSKNPLFLGVLPPKDRFPEKYVAVISGVPSTLHPEACILAIGRESPPIFALYWDKKPQFSLQGRTALWDSILILCHRINSEYGGFVRGIHIGSSALSILPVFDSEDEG